MTNFFNLKILKLAMSGAIVTGLLACNHSDDDDSDTMHKMGYQVRVYNLTAGQPMTPLAVIMHNEGYSTWMLGNSASDGLEKLAEGGDSTTLLTEAQADANYIYSASSINGPFLPGTSEMLDVEINHSEDPRLSLASMLANTNDAFTGVTNLSLKHLEKGDSLSMYLPAYDAGTEKNTESSGTLPGPADNGEGFNTARDEYASGKDFVSIHRGVVSMDDDLSTSVLTENHRWNGPVAKLVVTRMQ